MPFTPALIVGLISAAVGAAGVADTIYNQVNPPSASPQAATPATPAATAPSAGATRAQVAGVESTFPTLQSFTGGSLSPEYAAQWGGTQSGLGNDPQAAGILQQAINQYFGLGAPGQSGLTSPGGNSITDILSKVNPGGSPGATATGTGLVDNLLQSGDFKGFS